MNDTKRPRKSSKLATPAQRAPQFETDLIIKRRDEVVKSAPVEIRSVDDLEVTLQFAASLSKATSAPYFSIDGPGARSGSLELTVNVLKVRAICNGAWADVSRSNAAWCLVDARFAVNCFFRPGAESLHRVFRASLRRSGRECTKLFVFDDPARDVIEAQLKADAASMGKTPWLIGDEEEEVILPEETLMVMRVEADVPMISVRAGPWKGLKNHGCTCYLNSLMQCLFHIGAFRSFVYSLTLDEDNALHERVASFVKERLKTTSEPTWEMLDEVLREELGEFSFDGPLSKGELDRFTTDKSTICGVDVLAILELGHSTHGALQRLFAQMEVNSPLEPALESPSGSEAEQLDNEEPEIPRQTRDPIARVCSRVVECLPLILTFGWQNEDLFTQHDVQELNRLLIDKLEKVDKSDAKDVLKSLFAGECQSYIECVDVDYQSKRTEEFYDLQLDVRPDLATSLRDLHEVEILENENAYDSGKFGKQKARKGIRILRYPKILQFQLKRFKFGYDSFIKINDSFQFQPTVQLDDGVYELIAVSVHQGELNSGHYYSYVKCVMPRTAPSALVATSNTSPTEIRQWYLFDDESVHLTNEYTAVQNNYGGPYPLPLNRYSGSPEPPSAGEQAISSSSLSDPARPATGSGSSPTSSSEILATNVVPARRRPDSAYILFYSKVKDTAVDVNKFKGMLVRFYLEQSYGRYQERLSAAIQSSVIVCVPTETDIITTDESTASIAATGPWQSIDRMTSYTTYLRPISEPAELSWRIMCPPDELTPPKDIAEDLVDRPTCPQALYYLDIVKKPQQDALAGSYEANGLTPELRSYSACETDSGLVMWTFEYSEKDQISSMGKNHGYMNKDLRPAAVMGAMFTLIKVPVPTVVPPELRLGAKMLDDVSRTTGHLRNTYWKATPVKIFDPFSLSVFFFGFANIFHFPRAADLPLSHVVCSVYSTILRSWLRHRATYLQNQMSAQLAKFLDKYFDRDTESDVACCTLGDEDKNTTPIGIRATAATTTGAALPFFVPTPPEAAAMLEERCDYFSENPGWYEPRSLESLKPMSMKSRILTLSFRELCEAYSDSQLRTEHITAGAWFPRSSLVLQQHHALTEAALVPAVEYYSAGAPGIPLSLGFSSQELSQHSIKTDAAGRAPQTATDRGGTLPFADPCNNICDVLKHMRSFVNVQIELVTDPGALVQRVLALDHGTATPDCTRTSATPLSVSLCVDTRWSVTRLFAAIAWILSKEVPSSHGLVYAENLLVSGCYPLSSAIVYSRVADEGIGKLGNGSFVSLAQFPGAQKSCSLFLRVCGRSQNRSGYSSNFSKLVQRRCTRHEALGRAGPREMAPIRLAVILTRAKVQESCKLVAYNNSSATESGLIVVIDHGRYTYRKMLERVYKDLQIAAHARSLLYACEEGLAKTPNPDDTVNIDMYPVMRLDVIESELPWLEVVVNSQPHFVPLRKEATLAEVHTLLDLKPLSEARYSVIYLSDNKRTSLYDQNSVVLMSEVAEIKCGLTMLWDAALIITAPTRPKKQMTLN